MDTNTRILKLEVISIRTFNLNIFTFEPSDIFGKGWRFASEINGIANNDGITSFQIAITKASTLSTEDGRKLLFKTGLADKEVNINGENRIKILSGLPLADPDLLWSLIIEEGQNILKYLYDTYGVIYIEAIRRVLLYGPDARRYAFFIQSRGNSMWDFGYYWLGHKRSSQNPVLSLCV